MNANLLDLAQQALGGDFSKLAGQFLGESQPATHSAMQSLLPAVLGGIAQKGATPDGAASLLSLINGTKLDTGMLGNIAGLFGSGGAGASDLLKLGTSSLVPALFGDKSGGLVNALSSMSGIKSSSATNLLALVVPMVFTFLKKFVGDRSLNASSLSSLLSSQGPNLQKSLDGRLTSALGFASPDAFLSRLGGQATDTAKRAGAAVASGATYAGHTAAVAAETGKSALARWLPWLIAAAVLFFLWQIFANRSTPPAPVAPVPAPAAVAPKPAPAVVAPATVAAAPERMELPVKVYFDIGSATISEAGTKAIANAAGLVKTQNVRVDLTGYTDKTGNADANLELAKSRAKAVKEALMAAGVPESGITMQPPMFVTGTGSDAEARRVEISKTP